MNADAWTNARHWPVCYRTQEEAQIDRYDWADGVDRVGALVGWIFVCGLIVAVMFL